LIGSEYRNIKLSGQIHIFDWRERWNNIGILFSHNLSDPFECFRRIHQSCDCGDWTVLLYFLSIFGDNEVYFLLNSGSTKSEYGLIVFDYLFVKLKGQDINDIHICLIGFENSSDLIIFLLFDIFYCQSFEFFHRIWTYMNFIPITSLNDIPLNTQFFLKFFMFWYLTIDIPQNLFAGSFGQKASSPILLDNFDFFDQGWEVVVESFREYHFEECAYLCCC